MKNLFVLFTFFQLFLNSQTNNSWSVVEKNSVFTNCLFFAEKYYSERFNIDDFPEICACVLKNTIQTFKEEDYKSQIVIEVNKFQDNMFRACSNTPFGIKSTKEIKKTEPIIDIGRLTNSSIIKYRKDLYGTWVSDLGSTIIFNENGNYSETKPASLANPKETLKNGNWFIDEDGILTLNFNTIVKSEKLLKNFWYVITFNPEKRFEEKQIHKKHYFLSATSNFIKYKESDGNIIIQANRIK